MAATSSGIDASVANEACRFRVSSLIETPVSDAQRFVRHQSEPSYLHETERCHSAFCLLMPSHQPGQTRFGGPQVFVAVHSGTQRRSYALRLAKAGVRDRAAEDAVASRLLVRALAEAASVEGAVDVDLALMAGSKGAAQGTEELHVGVTCCVPSVETHRGPW